MVPPLEIRVGAGAAEVTWVVGYGPDIANFGDFSFAVFLIFTSLQESQYDAAPDIANLVSLISRFFFDQNIPSYMVSFFSHQFEWVTSLWISIHEKVRTNSFLLFSDFFFKSPDLSLAMRTIELFTIPPIRNFPLFQINRKMVNTIWFRPEPWQDTGIQFSGLGVGLRSLFTLQCTPAERFPYDVRSIGLHNPVVIDVHST